MLGAADPTLPTLNLHDPDRLARRIGRSGLIGFGESYMAGEWTSDDLAGVLTAFATSMADLVPRSLQRMRPIALARQPRTQHNSRDQARRNISQHYDLSNELFAEFLDETMTYSSALFDQLARHAGQPRRRAAAQNRAPTGLRPRHSRQPGSRDRHRLGRTVPTGRGAGRSREVGDTVGRAAAIWLGSASPAAGLSHLVDIELCDYRDVEGRYDAVMSIEMIEAVGYRVLAHLLPYARRTGEPGGRVAIQAITMPHSRMMASRNTHTWIQKYIFPGGLLPSTEAIMVDHRTPYLAAHRRHVLAATALCRDACGCGGSVSSQRRNAVSALGFDDVFQRMWELYLAYSEAGFRSGLSRRLPVGFRTDRRSMVNLVTVMVGLACRGARGVRDRPSSSAAHRPLQRRRRDLGTGFVAVAAVAAALGTGDLFRRVLLLVLVSVWGLRLAWHI